MSYYSTAIILYMYSIIASLKLMSNVTIEKCMKVSPRGSRTICNGTCGLVEASFKTKYVGFAEVPNLVNQTPGVSIDGQDEQHIDLGCTTLNSTRLKATGQLNPGETLVQGQASVTNHASRTTEVDVFTG